MKTKKIFTKDFILVIIGQIISLFGNAILRFALPLYLLRETGSATLFGIVTALSFLPMIFLSFLGGILADRVNKRNIMVLLDFLTAIIIFILSVTLNIIPIVPLIIVVLMLLYGISGTYQPTVQASIPALVETEDILSASAIINQIGALSNLLGPIIGGILFGSFGIMPILVISIICFLASAIMETFIKIPFEKRDNSMNILSIIKSDFSDSSNYIKNEKPILAKIMILVAVFNLVLTSMLIIGTPVLIIDTLGLSDQLLGISQGFVGLGGLCGGILTAILGHKIKLKNSHFLLFLCSICVAIMALPIIINLDNFISYVVLTFSSFLTMIFATMFSIKMIATVQTETPALLVGKVIALIMAIAMSAQPIGQIFYGFLFDSFKNNIGFVLLIISFISIVISLSAKRIFSKI